MSPSLFSLSGLMLLLFLTRITAIGQDKISLESDSNNQFISHIEIFGGPSLSNYWGKYKAEDQVVNMSYVFGLGLSHRLKSHFEINAKILLEKKGFKRDYLYTFYDQNNTPTTTRLVQGNKLDYWTVALSGVYYLGKHEHFYIGLGCSLSKLQKANTYTEEYNLQGVQISNYYAADNSYNDFDYGVITAFGYKIPLWRNIIFNTQLGGNLGVSDIMKSEIDHEGPLKLFNVWLTVGVTLKL